jgi:hypothetical protein
MAKRMFSEEEVLSLLRVTKEQARAAIREDRLITSREEVARILSTSVSNIWNLIQRGELVSESSSPYARLAFRESYLMEVAERRQAGVGSNDECSLQVYLPRGYFPEMHRLSWVDYCDSKGIRVSEEYSPNEMGYCFSIGFNAYGWIPHRIFCKIFKPKNAHVSLEEC